MFPEQVGQPEHGDNKTIHYIYKYMYVYMYMKMYVCIRVYVHACSST